MCFMMLNISSMAETMAETFAILLQQGLTEGDCDSPGAEIDKVHQNYENQGMRNSHPMKKDKIASSTTTSTSPNTKNMTLAPN